MAASSCDCGRPAAFVPWVDGPPPTHVPEIKRVWCQRLPLRGGVREVVILQSRYQGCKKCERLSVWLGSFGSESCGVVFTGSWPDCVQIAERLAADLWKLVCPDESVRPGDDESVPRGWDGESVRRGLIDAEFVTFAKGFAKSFPQGVAHG